MYCHKTSSRIVFFLLFLIIANGLSAQENSFNKFENVMLSPYSTASLALGWGITTYKILSNPNNMEGSQMGEEKIRPWAHHLHLGFGLHLVGAMMKSWMPETYQKIPYGLRFLSSIGGFIQMDDMYQHLVMQTQDNFNLTLNKNGTPAESPLHKLYLAVENRHNLGPFKMMFDLIQIKKLSLSAGYFQGPAGELSYDMFTIMDSKVSIQLNQTLGLQWNPKTQLSVEQCITGFSMLYHINPWLNWEVGTGKRWLNHNSLMKNNWIFNYGFRIG